MNAIPSRITATLLQRELLVAHCLQEQWVAQALMDAHPRHHGTPAEPVPALAAGSVAVHHARHVIYRVAAAVFGATARVPVG